MYIDIGNKEHECIKIVSRILAAKERENMKPFLTRMADYFSISFGFSFAGASVMEVLFYLLVLPLVIMSLPIGILFLVWVHIEEILHIRKIEKKYINCSYPEVKHIYYLWNQYGLTNSYDDNELANTVSDWISILYENQYHTSSDEIKRLFKLEEKKQGEAYNECYGHQGIRLNFKNWRHVVIDNIFDELPNYG